MKDNWFKSLKYRTSIQNVANSRYMIGFLIELLLEDQHANLAGHKANCSTLNPQFNILIDGHDCFPYLCNELGIKWYIQPILWGGRDTCLPIQVCCLELVSPWTVFTVFELSKTTLCCKQETAFTKDHLQCGTARRASSRVAGLFMFWSWLFGSSCHRIHISKDAWFLF